MSSRPVPVIALTSLVAIAAPGASQTTVIDEGSYEITVRGSEIGTENFTIRRSGSGANASTVAQGRVVLDTGEQIRTVLELRGTALRPVAYQVEVSGDNRRSVRGRASANRFRATIVSGAGERMREFLTDDRAVILEDGIAHHHYFVATALAGDGTIPVIIPRQSHQVTARVRDQGTETVQIGGREVSARHLSIRLPSLDDRSVWVDDQGRVLRMRIPDQELVAVRTSLP